MPVHRALQDRFGLQLHDRELQYRIKQPVNVRSIYGSKQWIKDLDIVNELTGHSGCVNALRYEMLPSDLHSLAAHAALALSLIHI